jgi:hypothetical protein
MVMLVIAYQILLSLAYTGRLYVTLPDNRRLVLAIHPGGPRRRSKSSAYVALVEERDLIVLQAYWRVEPVKGMYVFMYYPRTPSAD